jgi:hypothetical protein
MNLDIHLQHLILGDKTIAQISHSVILFSGFKCYSLYCELTPLSCFVCLQVLDYDMCTLHMAYPK